MTLSTSQPELLLHPRVAQQDVGREAAERVLATALPRIKPFRNREVHVVLALLDWDHRLPSHNFILRLHLLYEPQSRLRFEQALTRRRAEIKDRDLFPEFDVPDYGGLPADESYDVELSAKLEIEAVRLTSPWRREVGEPDGERAVAAVRASKHFEEVKAQQTARQPNLGDLEAVAWTPPCESNQSRWTLDVWWLTSFDGRVGKGWSFLVDPTQEGPGSVLSFREFTIRAG